MRFIFEKLALVNIAIGIFSNSVALHLAIFKITLVSGQIWPPHDSFALNLVFVKFTDINSACVSKVILAFPMELPI